MQPYVLFFSHSPQISWFALMAGVLRNRFSLPSVLWVIGDEDWLEGDKTGEFKEVVDLICQKLNPPLLYDVEQAIAVLKAFEEERGEVFVNQDIAMDRYVAFSQWPNERTLLYAGSLLLRMRGELERRGPPLFAVGEGNSLPYRLARRLVGAPYFCPHAVGHWGDRFYFEYTMYEQWSRCQEYYRRFLADAVPDELRERAERRLDELTIHQRPPAEMIRFYSRGGNSLRRRLTLRAAWGVLRRTYDRFLFGRNPWDPKSRSVLQDNVLHAVLRMVVEARCKWHFKASNLKVLPVDSEFAAFFLHMQPEHTVDGLAFEYRDQAATARTIAAALPTGMALLVKEHPTMVGRRRIEFYDELRSCPNIRLLDDTVSSYEVVRSAKLMFTLTGSVALESMYEGKPVIVLGHIYHSVFKGIYPLDNIRHLPELVREVLGRTDAGARREDAVAALASMYAASHPGKFSSQYTLEEMEQPENLDAIAAALMREFSLQQPSSYRVDKQVSLVY